MRVFGIDPGVTGAWAVVELPKEGAPRVLDIGDLPSRTVVMSRRSVKRLDVPGLISLFGNKLADPVPDRIVVERLTGAPNIASTTAFSLGWTAAVIDTLLCQAGFPHYLQAHPSAWKRALLVSADKEPSRRRATKLFGTDKHWPREKDHNRAEAALIALWGALTKA